MSDTSEAKGSVFSRGNQYIDGSIEELKKIHTPTRQEAFQATLVTMFIVVFISVVVALMDLVFGWITRMLL